MNREEKEVFRTLCNFEGTGPDPSLLQYATPHVLGLLFFNRMQAVAYGVLKQRNLLGQVNREFRNSLRSAYEQNLIKNHSFFQCVEQVCEALSGFEHKYAMLKGAVLCARYPQGYRTSNDIDLLLLPEHVTAIGKALNAAGFQQGNIRNDHFIPAARREIIESKMTRGETVPYVKEVGLPGMRFLEVDINFSLDYKNSRDGILGSLLNRAQTTVVDGLTVPTLEPSDFFIHLCSHLYKEASTLPWVRMKRDMTLYKYCDIDLLLSEMTPRATARMFERAKELGLERVCSYAIVQTAAFFDARNQEALRAAQSMLRDRPDWVHTVISPEDNKVFVYNERDIGTRFFMENRAADLKEVPR